jgi:hypothetical protein
MDDDVASTSICEDGNETSKASLPFGGASFDTNADYSKKSF